MSGLALVFINVVAGCFVFFRIEALRIKAHDFKPDRSQRRAVARHGHLQARVLKIDGLFVRNLPREHDNQVFVRAIIEVAHGMGKLTVAEFVEDEATLQMLRAMGVADERIVLDAPTACACCGGSGSGSRRDRTSIERWRPSASNR